MDSISQSRAFGTRKKVESNAEWIESINAFRRQVSANIAKLSQI